MAKLMSKECPHGYPFVGIYQVILRTPEFINWISNSYVTSEGFKKEFEIGQVMWLMDSDPNYRTQLEEYFTTTFKLPATKIAMMEFFQNKWSGRYWALYEDEEFKPDQDDRVISYSINPNKSFN